MRTEELDRERQRKRKAAAVLAAALLLTVLLCVFAGGPVIRLASEPEKFRLWVDGHGVLGRLAYMGMVILQVMVAFIPGEPLEIAAGYAFGSVEGTVLCLLASGTGSALVILLVRRYGRRVAELFFSREKLNSLRFLQASPQRTMLFLLIFMLPGTPKDLLCYFAGLTDIKLWMLLLICSVGRIPSVLTSTLGGDALGTKSYLWAAAIFVLTLLVSGGGLMIYNRICRKNQPAEKPAPSEGKETEEEKSA